MDQRKLRFEPGQARAGARVIIPDGRRGIISKWPKVTDLGLVKVDLERGGCYVCRVNDLEIDPVAAPVFVPRGEQRGQPTAALAAAPVAELEPQ